MTMCSFPAVAIGRRGKSQLTVSAVAANNTAHTHVRCTFKQTLGDVVISLAKTRQTSLDCENTVVNARNDLADTSSYTSLVAEISDVLAGLANDDTSFLGRDNGTKGQFLIGILLFGTLGDILAIVGGKVAEALGKVVSWRNAGSTVLSRHGVYVEEFGRWIV